MGSPAGGPPPSPGKPASEKKGRPSIIFMILDFLVFGGAVAALVLLMIQG
jgi:hypothetical protein